MKIELEALLYNSWNECENGWCAEAEAVAKLKDVSLSCSPDCEMTTDFELYYDDELIYKGDWTRLRKLAAIEEEERKTFMSANRAEFTEQKFLDFMYKKREWLITDISKDFDENIQETPVGIYTGTQHDTIEYCHQFGGENSWYDYQLIDHIN